MHHRPVPRGTNSHPRVAGNGSTSHVEVIHRTLEAPAVRQDASAQNMATNREEIFKEWAKPPGKAEEKRCQNGIGAIRNAIVRSEKLKKRRTKAFVQGSYRRRSKIRAGSRTADRSRL